MNPDQSKTDTVAYSTFAVIDLQDPARFLRHRHVRAEHAGQEAAEHDESPNKTLHEPFASLFLSLAPRLRRRTAL
jgi:hypothetical protein